MNPNDRSISAGVIGLFFGYCAGFGIAARDHQPWATVWATAMLIGGIALVLWLGCEPDTLTLPERP